MTTSTQTEAPVIRVKDLWKRFGSLDVLKGLTLDVMAGETLVILGRSGVGKSVLLKQLLGMERPDVGTIEINGLEITRLREKKRFEVAKSMGMLFQGSALFDSMNVGENTAFYLRQHGKDLKEKEIKDRVLEALHMVGLDNTENKMPSDLSGGMRKRAALARLIVYRPKILLYDEPTTGLDPITSMHINDLIKKTQAELKATSIVVTHDIKSALEIGDRLAFHSEGVISQIAKKSDFMKIDDPLLHAFFENAILTKDYLASKKEEPHA